MEVSVQDPHLAALLGPTRLTLPSLLHVFTAKKKLHELQHTLFSKTDDCSGRIWGLKAGPQLHNTPLHPAFVRLLFELYASLLQLFTASVHIITIDCHMSKTIFLLVARVILEILRNGTGGGKIIKDTCPPCCEYNWTSLKLGCKSLLWGTSGGRGKNGKHGTQSRGLIISGSAALSAHSYPVQRVYCLSGCAQGRGQGTSSVPDMTSDHHHVVPGIYDANIVSFWSACTATIEIPWLESATQILLPISKTPRREREHSRSIKYLVMKSFRSPPSPVQHPNRMKNTYGGSKTCFM